MPIISSLTAVTAKVYGLLSALVVKIQDSFNRTNNASSLGTTDTGQVWTNTRGTWGISGSLASTSDAGSTYPLASVLVGKTNNTVSANITNGGPGVAFWVTDANSWWASSVDYNSVSTTTSVPYSYCGGGYSSYQNPCPCGGTCSYQQAYYYQRTASTNTTYSCPGGGTVIGSGCYQYDESILGYYYLGPATPTTTTTYTCNSSTSPTNDVGCGYTLSTTLYCCQTLLTGTNSVTTTTYYTTLKLYSSVSGTVGVQSSLQIAVSNSAYQTADKIQTSTSNNSIIVRGYSGASQLGGALSFTATSPTKGPRTGIIRTPAVDNAGSTVDNFLSISD